MFRVFFNRMTHNRNVFGQIFANQTILNKNYSTEKSPKILITGEYPLKRAGKMGLFFSKYVFYSDVIYIAK